MKIEEILYKMNFFDLEGLGLRILNDYVIIHVLLLMILMLIVTVLNIYIFIRLKRTKATIRINLLSVSLLAFLLSAFFQVSSLDLEIERYFRTSGMIFLFICVILTFHLIMVLYKNNKMNKLQFISPDLPVLLKEIDDHIMIFDHDGKMNYQNHPSQLSKILGMDELSVSDLGVILLQRTPGALHKEIDAALHDKNKLDCEIYFSNTNQYFLLKTAPVLTNRKKLIAFIVLLHDISREKTLSDEIENKNKKLEDVNRQLISYVEVAH